MSSAAYTSFPSSDSVGLTSRVVPNVNCSAGPVSLNVRASIGTRQMLAASPVPLEKRIEPEAHCSGFPRKSVSPRGPSGPSAPQWRPCERPRRRPRAGRTSRRTSRLGASLVGRPSTTSDLPSGDQTSPLTSNCSLTFDGWPPAAPTTKRAASQPPSSSRRPAIRPARIAATSLSRQSSLDRRQWSE